VLVARQDGLPLMIVASDVKEANTSPEPRCLFVSHVRE
jgi:hypothetical protein